MAGAGYRNWTAGDVPTAAQFDQHLQEQTVMVFATAAARDTALSTAKSEGMVTFQKDTDQLTFYTGLAWIPVPGSEIAYAEKTADELNFTTVANIAGLTVTYTAVNGVKYRITGRCRTLQNVAGATQSLFLTDGSNGQLAEDVVSFSSSNVIGWRQLVHRELWAGATGSVTRKLRLQTSAGNADVIAAVGRVGFILVEAM